VHTNTARFHLDALVEEGILERITEAPSGRGRPRISFRPRPGLARGGTRRYQLLAEILLSHLASDTHPRDAASRAGRLWGAHLISRPAPGLPIGATDAVERLTAMLDELDFAPEPDTAATSNPASDTEAADSVPDSAAADSLPGSATAGLATDAGPVERIRLRHCPFLELAEPHRELVCTLHLGLMQGALAELGAPLTVTELRPFAEPDACMTHLKPVTR
jgi:predicted ArsR family transcriptional regulator